MKLKTLEKNNVAILRLEDKRLDSSIAADLKAHLLVMIDQGAKSFLIDLKNVEYADSSGLGAILFGIRQMRPVSGQVKLVNLQPRVLSLIKIAKLDNVIEAYDDEKEALASFNE
jgi:anti-sigma B factor antagonist